MKLSFTRDFMKKIALKTLLNFKLWLHGAHLVNSDFPKCYIAIQGSGGSVLLLKLEILTHLFLCLLKTYSHSELCYL